MQMQLEQKQKKAVKSNKYPPFAENEIQSLQKKFKTLDQYSRGSITLEEF
jgi:Ca2+-binding EF-hand superfamily protein